MATHEYRLTLIECVKRDPAFARGLLQEAATLMLNGEPGVACGILRDLVNGTVGFERLAKLTGTPAKSLHRMLSRRGNPRMDNLSAIFGALGKKLRVEISVKVRAA
jgi:DNA-binding phage protein